MGWQEDLARTNDPYLMTPSAVRKSAAASNRASLARRRKSNIDSDSKGAFLAARGDAGQMWRDLSGPVRESGLYKDASTMVKDLGSMVNFPGLMSLLPSLGSVGENMEQNEENERILGDLYTDDLRKTMVPGWDNPSSEAREYHDKYKNLASLTDDADKKEYYLNQARSAYRNANVTRRVNYALGDLGFDTSAEAGKAAFEETPTEFEERINYSTLPGKLQSGLEGTDAGEAFLKRHAVPKEGDTPAITKAIENFYGGPTRLAEDLNTRIPPLSQSELMDVTQSDIPIKPKPFPPGYGEEWDIDTSPYRIPISRQGPLDISPEEQELLMAAYTDPEGGAPQYREGPTPITHVPPNPTIDQIAGTGYTDYRGVNPFREPYVPMEGPSPVPLPSYLSADTDWWTPEPEAKGLIPRGLEELIIDPYGVDSPGVPRERQWPNTPPPGYERPPWYNRAWDWMKEGDWPRY